MGRDPAFAVDPGTFATTIDEIGTVEYRSLEG